MPAMLLAKDRLRLVIITQFVLDREFRRQFVLDLPGANCTRLDASVVMTSSALWKSGGLAKLELVA